MSSTFFDYNLDSPPEEFLSKKPWEYLEGYDPSALKHLNPKIKSKKRQLSAICWSKEEGEPDISWHLAFAEDKALIRICEFLTPKDFLNLALTCRYIHWRVFAFCRCIRGFFNLYVDKSKELWFNPKLNMDWIRKQQFFDSFSLCIYSKFDDFTRNLDELAEKLLPFRDNIGRFAVLVMFNRNVKEFDKKAMIAWNSFLQTMRADVFYSMALPDPNKSIEYFPISLYFLSLPYVKQLEFIQMETPEHDALQWMAISILNRNGIFSRISPYGIITALKEFVAGTETFDSRFFFVSYLEQIPLLTIFDFNLFGIVLKKVKGKQHLEAEVDSSKGKKIQVYPEARVISLFNDKGSKILSKINEITSPAIAAFCKKLRRQLK